MVLNEKLKVAENNLLSFSDGDNVGKVQVTLPENINCCFETNYVLRLK